MTIDELLAAAPVLSVGIVSGDLLDVWASLDAVRADHPRFIHIDVMDGVFCPGITVGASMVKAIPEEFVKDVHLMVDEPLSKGDAFVEAGANLLTFHVEATRHPHRVLQSLSGRGVLRGVALNPGTAVSSVEPLLDEMELLLLLAVNPGWSGQAFVESTRRRVHEARELMGSREIAIGVDGGITQENIAEVASLGCDLIVAGSAVYDGGSPTANAEQLEDRAQAGHRGLT